MKKKLTTIIPLCIFLIGLSILLYPTVSDLWNKHHQSTAIAGYQKYVEKYDPELIKLSLAEANTYNQVLASLQSPFSECKDLPMDYENILNIDDQGMIGYLEVDKIDLNIPIYHSVKSEILDEFAGHMEGSSLPVGGPSTHSVISAHTGLPSAKLFSDIDQLEIGDKFRIIIFDEIFTYEVDQVKVVLPEEMENLAIVPNEDYVTLLTCTPYGVNTHRLLVRGHRIANGSPNITKYDHKGLQWDKIILILMAIFFIILAILVARRLYKKKKIEQKDDTIIEKIEEKRRE